MACATQPGRKHTITLTREYLYHSDSLHRTATIIIVCCACKLMNAEVSAGGVTCRLFSEFWRPDMHAKKRLEEQVRGVLCGRIDK